MTKDYVFEGNVNLMARLSTGEKVYYSGSCEHVVAWVVRRKDKIVKSGFSVHHAKSANAAASFINTAVESITALDKQDIKQAVGMDARKYKVEVQKRQAELDKEKSLFSIEFANAEVVCAEYETKKM